MMIPFFGIKRQYKNLREELLEATDVAMKEGIWLNGPHTDMFKHWLRQKTNTEYAVLCHSGTQALELLAKFAAYTGLLSEISISNLSYPATLNAFLSLDTDIELVDTDKNGLYPNGFHMGVKCLVGLYGAHPIKSGMFDIVDGAQHWLIAENVGLGMAISFDPTKNLPSSGNGGAIVTNNRAVFEFLERQVDNGKPNHQLSGTNSKMSELECAHMLVRVNHIDAWQDRRKEIKNYYIDRFNDLPVRCLSKGHALHSDHKFVIEIDDNQKLLKYLNHCGIETKIHYPYALSELGISESIKNKPYILSTSVMLSRRVLSLPIYPELTDLEVEFVAEKVRKFYLDDK